MTEVSTAADQGGRSSEAGWVGLAPQIKTEIL